MPPPDELALRNTSLFIANVGFVVDGHCLSLAQESLTVTPDPTNLSDDSQ
jgi:hypothetical protein